MASVEGGTDPGVRVIRRTRELLLGNGATRVTLTEVVTGGRRGSNLRVVIGAIEQRDGRGGWEPISFDANHYHSFVDKLMDVLSRQHYKPGTTYTY